uniref:Uncharacterized protein n=1 Tax=Candidatus Kentrum sp. MB TaxID=2138164 RepID=A0A450XT74_9GAMM|nr:MAG: hypothetical protein BECKMB1821G_GA0114241_11152 [Candidatus Kentron sp. MB]VFK35491.1 MAG: hypothetical protein BECKMB1821I_GA0114274_11216 [Candidatus Kentron sp. MB]VFK75720.1 MAG: hypothetical protein BECKMB1821H_GA0114242_10303 [Candidatus Kentron sp. MB]
MNPVGIGVGLNRDRAPTSVRSALDPDWVGRRPRLGLMPIPVEVDTDPRLSWICLSPVQRIETKKGWCDLERRERRYFPSEGQISRLAGNDSSLGP